MKNKLIAIGSDHAGFGLKEALKPLLDAEAIDYKDYGTHSTDSVDYPKYAKIVAKAVTDGEAEKGILICGTGLGMCYTANRFKGVRAALSPNTEYARLAAAHNNANILCLSGRMQTPVEAIQIIKTWLSTPYESGRHDKRISMIDE